MSFIACYSVEKKVDKIFSKILFLKKILNEFFLKFANHLSESILNTSFKTKSVYQKMSIGWM